MMVEEAAAVSSAPTLWAVINSWFTSTVFFVVLQLVIATIYITSNIAATTNQKQSQGTESQQQQLPRSPSTLQRLKSTNFNSYAFRSQLQQPPLQVQVRNLSQSQTHEEGGKEEQHPDRFARSPITFPHTDEPEKNHLKSDDDEGVNVQIQNEEGEAGPSLDEVYSKLVQRQGRHFNRSKSDTTAPSDEVPVKLVKKSACTKSALSAAVEGGGDDGGVDAKADDFISKFREQLKLQRLDSVTRYKASDGDE